MPKTKQTKILETSTRKVDPPQSLIEKCSHGDEESLREFFELYSKEIYNFPAKVFHLDEDSASDFFLYAYERLSNGARFRSFQRRSSFQTWFYTVLRNLVIDWMRTLRELETVNSGKNNDGQQEFDLIANIPDPASIVTEDNHSISVFRERLISMPIEMRVLFKLSYIYYLELEKTEMEYLSIRNGKDTKKILDELLQLRHKLTEKELKNISAEDKITSLYLTILEMEAKKKKLEQLIEKQNLPDNSRLLELERIEQAVQKKNKQRKRLIENKNQGHYIVRTPYCYVANLLKTSEGNISVQMMRILGRLQESNVA